MRYIQLLWPAGENEMTQDEIIRMAREAGIQVTIDWAGRPTMVSIGVNGNVGLTGTEELERFAALVAAHEREVCAKVCDDIDTDSMIQNWKSVDECAKQCAAAIRARGM